MQLYSEQPTIHSRFCDFPPGYLWWELQTWLGGI